VQLCMGLKGLKFTPHVLDIATGGNRTDFYLGVNPRGLVPCLVHDGQVIIESNDIMLHIDKHCPEPPLQPQGKPDPRVQELLDGQDAYHMDIRNLTFRYILPPFVVIKKSTSDLAKMDAEDAGGKVKEVAGGGQGRAAQRAFNQSVVDNGGISDQMVSESVENFRKILGPIEKVYENSEFLVGDSFSMVDLAYWCDIERLLFVGYPVAKEFPCLLKTHENAKKLLPEKVLSLGCPTPIRVFLAVGGTWRSLTGSTLKHYMAGTKPRHAAVVLAPAVAAIAGALYWSGTK